MHLKYSLGDSDNGDLACVPALLRALPNLAAVELPVGALDLDGTVGALRGRARLEELVLFDHEDSGELIIDRLVTFLEEVKVGRLVLGQCWWEWGKEAALEPGATKSAEEMRTAVNDLAEGWRRRVHGLVTAFELK